MIGFRPLALIGVAVAIWPGPYAEAQSSQPRVEAPTTRIPETLIGNFRIERLRASLQVYGNSDDRIHAFPVFWPDVNRFRADVAALCDGKPQDHETSARLHVHFWDSLLSRELAAAVSADTKKEIPPSKVVIFPYYQIKVYATAPDIGTSNRLVWDWPQQESELAFTLRTDISEEPREVGVTGTCAYLTELANSPEGFKATLLSATNEERVDTIEISIDRALETLKRIELEKQESQTGGITNTSRSSSRSGGVGVSLGPISGGSGRASGSATVVSQDSRHRLVTDTYLQNAVEEVVGELRVIAYMESERDFDSAVGRLLSFVSAQSESVQARFDTSNAADWKLVVDGTVVRSLGQSEVNAIMAAKPAHDSSMTASETQTARDGEGNEQASSRNDTALGQKYSNDISWTRNGNDWVPTSVKLNAVSFGELRNTQTARETLIRAIPRTNRIEHELMLIKQDASEHWSTLAGELKAARARLDVLEARFAGQESRKGGSYYVRSPRMGAPTSASCPPGTFVVALETKGIGGKYAVDAIGQIHFTCAPLR